jgi:cell division protein FtsL
MELILLVLILIAAMSTVDRDHRLRSRKIAAACGLKHRG